MKQQQQPEGSSLRRVPAVTCAYVANTMQSPTNVTQDISVHGGILLYIYRVAQKLSRSIFFCPHVVTIKFYKLVGG